MGLLLSPELKYLNVYLWFSLSSLLHKGVWERTPSTWTTGQRTAQRMPAQITSTAKERWFSNLEILARRSRWVESEKQIVQRDCRQKLVVTLQALTGHSWDQCSRWRRGGMTKHKRLVTRSMLKLKVNCNGIWHIHCCSLVRVQPVCSVCCFSTWMFKLGIRIFEPRFSNVRRMLCKGGSKTPSGFVV